MALELGVASVEVTKSPANGTASKIDCGARREIAVRWANGESASELSKEFKISRQLLYTKVRLAIREMAAT